MVVSSQTTQRYNNVIRIIKHPKIRPAIQIVLLIATLVLFTWYFLDNHGEFAKIRSLSIIELALVLIGQMIAVFGNVLVIIALGMFFNKKIPLINATKIGAYSSVVNFFGFLQGGFGVRGVYLKTQYNISIKNYLSASVIQYIILFGLAGSFIMVGFVLLGFIWPLFVLLVLALGVVTLFLFIKLLPKIAKALQKLMLTYTKFIQLKPISALVIATLVYLIGGLLAFGVELSVVGAHISMGSLLVYTGLTQFTILIALTPGGLGIREGILLIAQSQMMLTTSDIIVASTIDRVVYFITLFILFVFSIGADKYIGKGDIL
ncbi:flippase-like domain-containing protein [Candidatus Saccharibacteria bacterium]|nr:flippase-like domain-containing protein [Candidatus Saccharibacteria bacterium]